MYTVFLIFFRIRLLDQLQLILPHAKFNRIKKADHITFVNYPDLISDMLFESK